MKALKIALSSMTSACALVFAAGAATIQVAPGADDHETLQAALLDVKPGDTIELAAGTYTVNDGLSLDVDDVVIKGAGADKTMISFANQQGAGEGLLVTSDRVTLREFAILDSKGDGIKAKDTEQISFINLRVEWTGGPNVKNGAYGVYPVGSTNVLIDGVTVRGASDAGIYVGQSKNIIVKRSTAEYNVAGIEIENCYNADVFDNLATHNAGGILVFDLPNLVQMAGHSARIFHNKVVSNDTPNFAPPGNTVAGVPTGTGIMVVATRDAHIFENEIDDNSTAAVMIVATRKPFDDKAYNPIPRDIVVRDNTIGKNGFAPTFEGGKEVAAALGGSLPPVTWDGITSYMDGEKKIEVPVNLIVKDGPVLNLHLSLPSTPVTEAKPEITPTIEGAPITEPAPIVLPEAQAKLSS